MRILVTADLHYQPTQRAAFLDFAQRVSERRPDVFILAGDVGHPLRLFQRGLQLFRDLACPRLFIAGNHDLYRGEFHSRDLWQVQLPHIAQIEGFAWLEDHNLVSEGVGVCGTMGWYDYSARAPHLPYVADEYRALKRLVNHDADFVDWPWSDVAMARYLQRGFTRRLASLEADPAVRQIVVITHWPIFEESMPQRPQSAFWSLLSAYMANFTLGRLVRQGRKVTHVVSGHIHRPGRWIIPGAHGSIEFTIVGSRSDELTWVELNL